MEEKERYEVHIYDDVRVDLYNNGVLDKSINDTYKLEKLLNQQDKELSKLRASYQQVKEENSQLKQQLHDLPKKIVEEIRKWGQKHYNWVGDGTGYDGQDYNECIGFNMAIDQLNEILDTILKKYGGEDESK